MILYEASKQVTVNKPAVLWDKSPLNTYDLFGFLPLSKDVHVAETGYPK